MDRLIFTVARGAPKYAKMALGLGRSLRLTGSPIPTAILTDIADQDWSRYYDVVIRPQRGRSALDKLDALELTDAKAVVAIDCDCLAIHPLEDVFDYCEGKPFAIQGDFQSSGTWHGARVEEVCARFERRAIPRFNGGFLYYERGAEMQRLLEAMRSAEDDYEASGFGKFRGNASEEVCILLAMLRSGLGEVIPDDTDFMSTAVGLIGRLHLNVAAGECSFLCRRARARHIRPYIFHASRYSNFLVYWRELSRLRRLMPPRP